MEKQAGAAPPQQGMTQYWSALHVVLSHAMGPPPPLLAVLPPVASPPPMLVPPALCPPLPVEPPTLLEPAFEMPPVLTIPPLSVPLQATERTTTDVEATVRSATRNCMVPHVQAACRALSARFARVSRGGCAMAVPGRIAKNIACRGWGFTTTTRPAIPATVYTMTPLPFRASVRG
jgi:hypothetical protein